MYFGLTTGPFIVVIIYAIVAFFVTLKYPKWGFFALIPIIGLGFSEASVLKGGIVALITLGVILNALVTGRKIIFKREVLAILLVLLAFIAWIAARSFLGDEGLAFWAFWITKRLFSTILIALLAVFLIRTREDAWQCAQVLIGFSVITALVGILQYIPGWQIFWSAREILGVPPDVAYQIFGKIRIVGLAAFVVPLSYQLLSIFPIALAGSVAKINEHKRPLWNLFSTVVIFIGLALTFIKAGIGGAVIGGGFVIGLLANRDKLRPHMKMIAGGIFFVGLVIILLTPSLKNNIFRIGDTTTERIPITIAAIKVLRENPLGTGYAYNARVGDIYPEIADYPGASLALVQFPHSIVLGIATILGIPAFVLAFLFYVLLFKGLWGVVKKNETLQVLAIGLIGSFIAYLINALFHNNNPFFGDTFNWILIGLALAVMNIAE